VRSTVDQYFALQYPRSWKIMRRHGVKRSGDVIIKRYAE
jgi:hypothetical protein